LWAVDHREEAVSRRTYLAASKPSELAPDDGIMRIEQAMPVTVADLRLLVYATVINVLSLEKEAANTTARVADIHTRRRRDR